MLLYVFCIQWLMLFVGCSANNILYIDETNTKRLTVKGELPTVLKESSGLEWATTDLLWSHNDHKSNAELYAIDLQGNLVKTISLPIENEDWEDLAVDEADKLYIGDFGNNDNERQDLRIYRVSTDILTRHNNEISVETIEFYFPEQTTFPPVETKHYFDVEAMLVWKEQIYLFTRDRSKPFSGTTRIYHFPATTGKHAATFITTLATAEGKNDGQITAADLSPDGQTIALLSNHKVWLLEETTFPDIKFQRIQEIDLPIKRQMEGLVFRDECTLYLTNESKKDEPGELFELQVCGF